MTKDEIVAMLDKLSELEAQQDALRLKKTELINGVLTEEIRQQIADIELEFSPDEKALAEVIQAMNDMVKKATIVHGGSVSGAHRQAVYCEGKVSWDTKGLEGYAAARPELLAFKKQGLPYVSIKSI